MLFARAKASAQLIPNLPALQQWDGLECSELCIDGRVADSPLSGYHLVHWRQFGGTLAKPLLRPLLVLFLPSHGHLDHQLSDLWLQSSWSVSTASSWRTESVVFWLFLQSRRRRNRGSVINVTEHPRLSLLFRRDVFTELASLSSIASSIFCVSSRYLILASFLYLFSWYRYELHLVFLLHCSVNFLIQRHHPHLSHLQFLHFLSFQ